MDELRARTNPAFIAAKSTLVYLMKAGDEDAAMMAEELHIDPERGVQGRTAGRPFHGHDGRHGRLP